MRVVLDTNVWLDWLVFDDPGIAFLKQGFADRLFEIVIDDACEAEFERVLAYPLGKFPVDAPACMAQLRRIATRAGKFSPEEKMRLPRCSDPDDQKFLELALGAGAQFLITKDQALLKLGKRKPPFRIMTPDAFAKIGL